MDLTNESTSITVKTTNRQWHRIIFITPILFLSFITLLVILSHSSSSVFASSLFLTLFFGLGSYFLANYLTKSDTHFSFDYGILSIEQTNNKLKKDTLRQFEVSSIRGYEIWEAKNGQSLIIYLNDYAYYKYPLYSITESLKLKAFFADRITELTTKHNPNFKNFWAAFLFALLRVSMCTLTLVGIVCGTLFLANYFQWSIANHKLMIVLLYSAVSILCWIFMVSLPAKYKNIRYMGFAPHILLFLGFSFLLILLANVKINSIKENPITISQLNDILNHPKEELFYIQHTSYNPKRTLLYRPIIKNGRKGRKFSVDHVFATPITSSTTKEPIQLINFWITQKYTQRIPKARSAEYKESMIREFSIQSRAKLINQLRHKPKFYKILSNELNVSRNHTAVYELIKSSRIFNTVTIILEPHWETLEAYRRRLKFQLFWMYAGIITLNIIAAIIIAINR